MKRRPLLVLLMVALGGLAYWLWKKDTGGTFSGQLTDFAIADTSKVTRFFIAEGQSGRTVDVVRSADGRWTANGFPANQNNVNLVLKTFARIEMRGPVPKSAEANVLRIMSSTAKKVEIYEGDDEPSKIWYVGHATQDHFGTFMLLEKPGEGKSTVPFEMSMSGMTGFLSPRFFASLDDWRSTDVFVYKPITTLGKVQVQHPGAPESSFTVEYSGEMDLVLRDRAGQAVSYDTAAVSAFVLAFENLHFEAFERRLEPARRDSILESPPYHIVTVTKRDGGTRTVTFYKKPPYPGEKDLEFKPVIADMDRMYALMDDTVLVVVQRQLFDWITPPLPLLRPAPMPVPNSH